MRGASSDVAGANALKPNHLPAITGFEQEIDARAKRRIVIGLTVSFYSRFIIIEFIQKEFVGIVRIGADIEMAAAGLFFERIARLGLERVAHFFALSRKSFKINYDGNHLRSLQAAIAKYAGCVMFWRQMRSDASPAGLKKALQ